MPDSVTFTFRRLKSKVCHFEFSERAFRKCSSILRFFGTVVDTCCLGGPLGFHREGGVQAPPPFNPPPFNPPPPFHFHFQFPTPSPEAPPFGALVGEPRKVEPRRVGPEGWSPEGWGGPKFCAFFSLSRRKIRSFLPSGSLFVQSWWCFRRPGRFVHVWSFSGCCVRALAAPPHFKPPLSFSLKKEENHKGGLNHPLV